MDLRTLFVKDNDWNGWDGDKIVGLYNDANGVSLYLTTTSSGDLVMYPESIDKLGLRDELQEFVFSIGWDS